MRWLVALLLAVFAAAGDAAAAGEDPRAAVKAAYLVRFLGYVEWPVNVFEGPQVPEVIGVFGADAVLAELQALADAGQGGEGRPLLARRLVEGDTLDGVHVLLLGRDVAPQAAALAGRPLLVVTDAPAGPPPWAMLNFVVVDGRVRFEAAPAVAERAGLKLSSRLLAVAARVLPPP